MTFTLDPSTDRGRVRLLVGDTDTSTTANQIFRDAEIDSFLALESNDVYAAAAAAASSIASSQARQAIVWRAMGRDLEIDKRDIPKRFAELADSYRKRSQAAPSEEIDSLDYQVTDFGEDLSEYVGDTAV